MSNLVPVKHGVSTMRDYSPSQIDLIRRTVAKDTNKEEFDMFIEICRRQQLDPFRKQIYAFVFNKDDAKKRQFVPVTGIDGYRAIAKRAGNYRPDESEPYIEYDEKRVDPQANPYGIVKATVKVWQYGPDREWHAVVGIARWDEYAPMGYDDSDFSKVDTGEVYEDSGRKKYKKVLKEGAKKRLSKENWRSMSHTMIAKCAEAQALRRGWPEEMGGLYTHEEIGKVEQDLTASEAADKFLEEERMRIIGGNNAIPFVFDFMNGIEMVPVGKVADRILEHISALETASEIEMWRDGNRAGLNVYWAKHKSEALEVKTRIEAEINSRPAFIEHQPENKE